MAAGVECKQKKGAPPNLIVVILPDGGNDIYTAVKQYVCVLIFAVLF
jgi:eukaryotic translation initiation factor 2C